MTERDHMPPQRQFAVRKISPRSIHFCVNGHALFLSPDGARRLIEELGDELAGPGPQIVCEVVEQVRI